MDEAKFALTVDKLRASMEIKTGDNPVETVEVLGDRYLLNKMSVVLFFVTSLWAMTFHTTAL